MTFFAISVLFILQKSPYKYFLFLKVFSNFLCFNYIIFYLYVKRLSYFFLNLLKPLLKLDFLQENVYYIN